MKYKVYSLCCCLGFLFSETNAQRVISPGIVAGLTTEMHTSGNGHGTFYSALLTMNSGRNTIGIGPLLHKRSSELNGVRIIYSYNLSTMMPDLLTKQHTELFQLNFFGSLQYNKPTQLSYNVARDESAYLHEPVINWNLVRLETIEMAVGFSIRLNISERIYWKNYVAMGGYYHFETS